jgi:inosine-uridine nucleoside N-ribohydrolase
VAQKIQIGSRELATLQTAGSQAKLLAGLSEPWLEHWQSAFKSDGFYPFDSLAVGLAITPEQFTCARLPARVQRKPALFIASRDQLLVSADFIGGPEVMYCHDIAPRFKLDLLIGLQR